MAMGYLEPEEPGAKQDTTCDQGRPLQDRLLTEIEQGTKLTHDRRRALRILQAHPEFEDFLWLLRSGLVPIIVLVWAAIAAQAQAAPLPGTDHKIITSYNAPTPDGVFWAGALCSSTVTKSCLVGYTEVITPPAGVSGGNVSIPITLGSTTVCGSTVTANCMANASGTGYIWAPSPGPLFSGSWGITVAANYLDSSGNSVTSPTISTTVTEPAAPFVAAPVTGLTGSTAP